MDWWEKQCQQFYDGAIRSNWNSSVHGLPSGGFEKFSSVPAALVSCIAVVLIPNHQNNYVQKK
jgi:hypothetical protein